MQVIRRSRAPRHEERIRELTRIEAEEGAGGSHGQPYGDREAIGYDLAPKCVTDTCRWQALDISTCGDVVEFKFNV